MVSTDQEVAATQPFGASIAHSSVAFAPFSKVTRIVHEIRALDPQAGMQAAGAASGSPAGAKGVAGVVTRFVAWIAAAIADELRIRRDMRQLRAHGRVHAEGYRPHARRHRHCHSLRAGLISNPR
jgi:hypothetical protein